MVSTRLAVVNHFRFCTVPVVQQGEDTTNRMALIVPASTVAHRIVRSMNPHPHPTSQDDHDSENDDDDDDWDLEDNCSQYQVAPLLSGYAARAPPSQRPPRLSHLLLLSPPTVLTTTAMRSPVGSMRGASPTGMSSSTSFHRYRGMGATQKCEEPRPATSMR